MPPKIVFENSAHSDIEIDSSESPSEVLNTTNSPVLFGCRTGICGTCIVNVLEGGENLPDKSEDEQEVLEIMAPDHPNARLACQVKLRGDIKIEYIGK